MGSSHLVAQTHMHMNITYAHVKLNGTVTPSLKVIDPAPQIGHISGAPALQGQQLFCLLIFSRKVVTVTPFFESLI